MLDYTTREKKFLSVKLIDGRTMFLAAPKKSLYTRLDALKDDLESEQDADLLYDTIVQLAADILSTNKAGTKFSAAEVDDMMDIEDMSLLIFEYTKYAGGLTGNPN